MPITDIEHAASDLTERERGALALWLLDSLPPNNGEDASAEGIEEAVKRREQLDSGKAFPLSSEEFWASLERERAAWK